MTPGVLPLTVMPPSLKIPADQLSEAEEEVLKRDVIEGQDGLSAATTDTVYA